MKKNYIAFLLAILFSGIAIAQETQKNYINYQGVARNADNALMSFEEMTINIALKFGNASTASMYEESHAITTDANGVFSLLIGNGSPAKGDYNALPWGSAATFATVSLNGNEIGTTEMMSVPYAISAGKAVDQSAAEVLYDNSVSGLSASTAQEAIDELITGGSVDTDSDPSNEFQILSFDSATSELSLSDGNTIVIPTDGTDADADPTNEIQTISFDAASNKISLTDGGEITIPSGGTDADADPANELQTLSFDAGTNELSLSEGNTIVIPAGGVDGDGDSTNEIQTISFDAITNELSLSDGGAVTIPSGGTDADADPTNEIQDISLAGTELTISDGSTIDLAPIVPPGGTDDQNLIFDETTKILEIEDGNTVDLSSLAGGGGGSLWTENGGDINYTTGVVGIGTATPGFPLDVKGTVETTLNLQTSDDNNFIRFVNSDGYQGYAGILNGNQDMDFGTGTGNVTGKVHLTIDSTPKLTVANDGNVGIGTMAPSANLDVDGNIKSSDLSGTGQRNVMADADGNLVIGAGGGGSSLWNENGSRIYYNSGNVGIGTDLATSPLEIVSDDDSPILIESTRSDGNGWIRFNKSGRIGYVGMYGVNGPKDIDMGTSSSNSTGKVNLTIGGLPKLTVAANGNVGIGGSNPTAKLHIFQGGQDLDTGLRFSDGLNEDWTIRHGFGLSFFFGTDRMATISANNGAYIQVSDARMKSNIESLGGVLKKVIQLRPATYNYKADKSKKITVGLIAQELQLLFPELVSLTGEEKLLGLDYGALSVVSIKAIQEQQQIIDAQSKKIIDLDKRLKRLEAKMSE